MFELDMTSIRQAASGQWLMANLANREEGKPEISHLTPEISQQRPQISHKPPELAGLAELAAIQIVSHESADLLDARLIAAAMRVCYMHGDGEQAREDMRADCLDTPLHLRADLLDHFTALQKLHSSSAGCHSGFHAGCHQNGDDQVETTSTTTNPKSTTHHA